MYWKNIYYEIYGEQNNETIIFLHGNGEDLHIFDKSIEFFKKRYKIIAIDSPEHGKSKYKTLLRKNNHKLNIPFMADEIDEFIEKLKLSDVTLVGFSDGANITMEIASKKDNSKPLNNQKIKKIVLVGGNLKPTGMKTHIYLAVLFSFIKYSIFSFVHSERLKRKYYKIMLFQPKITKEKLAKINIPTLIIAGENDMIKHSHTKEINTYIKNSHIEIISDGDHFLFAKKNNEINKLIEKFIGN